MDMFHLFISYVKFIHFSGNIFQVYQFMLTRPEGLAMFRHNSHSVSVRKICFKIPGFVATIIRLEKSEKYHLLVFTNESGKVFVIKKKITQLLVGLKQCKCNISVCINAQCQHFVFVTGMATLNPALFTV